MQTKDIPHNRQAGAEITQEMLDAGSSVLSGWYADEIRDSARDIVEEVWSAMFLAQSKDRHGSV